MVTVFKNAKKEFIYENSCHNILHNYKTFISTLTNKINYFAIILLAFQ